MRNFVIVRHTVTKILENLPLIDIILIFQEKSCRKKHQHRETNKQQKKVSDMGDVRVKAHLAGLVIIVYCLCSR